MTDTTLPILPGTRIRRPRQPSRYSNAKHGRITEPANCADGFDFPDTIFRDDDAVVEDFDILDHEPSPMTAAPGKIRPPVKWHGGKFYQVTPIIQEFSDHRIYIEPFGGGASILLNKPPVDVEVYNDLDQRITRLFRVLRDEGEALIEYLRLTLYSQLEFEAAAKYPENATEVQKAACDYVRWRQSFGGKGGTWSCGTTRARGGMAGDVNAWHTAIEQLPLVIERIKRVQITCKPAIEVIRRFDHVDALFYCDPTYVASTRSSPRVYAIEMTDQDHRELAAVLKQCSGKAVISGYPSALYDELFAGWNRVEFEAAKHSAGGKTKARATECLWKNF